MRDGMNFAASAAGSLKTSVAGESRSAALAGRSRNRTSPSVSSPSSMNDAPTSISAKEPDPSRAASGTAISSRSELAESFSETHANRPVSNAFSIPRPPATPGRWRSVATRSLPRYPSGSRSRSHTHHQFVGLTEEFIGRSTQKIPASTQRISTPSRLSEVPRMMRRVFRGRPGIRGDGAGPEWT